MVDLGSASAPELSSRPCRGLGGPHGRGQRPAGTEAASRWCVKRSSPAADLWTHQRADRGGRPRGEEEESASESIVERGHGRR